MSCTPRLAARVALAVAALTFVFAAHPHARAQAIGAHRGDIGGTGGDRTIRGRILSPTGKLPATRIRVNLDSTNSSGRSATADPDGNFYFSNLEVGSYTLTVDAGKEYEAVREPVYIGGAQQTINPILYLRVKPEAHPALAGVPGPAVALYLRGVEAARRNDADAAVGHFEQAVAQHAAFGLAHRDLGALYLRAGKFDKAAESLKAAVKAMPDDAEARRDYGVVLLEKKEFGAAEEQLRAALKAMDESAPVHMYMGVALMRQRKLDDAERELRQAVKLGGERMARAHYYLGGIYWAKNEFKRAADELETYLKLTPKAADAEQVKASVKQLRAKQ
ncbi:MAG TPA: tetratricopeptide repeat protein [Pyrinomonadaceae bacterium]|nr:tetratricopeptide repeat protein [Pyrinomonadaceae bacterium]